MRLYVLLVLAVVAMLIPSPAEAQWAKPTDWLTPCTGLAEVLEERHPPERPQCDDVHSNIGVKANLDWASRWLEGLGFASPAIAPDLDLAHHMQNQPETYQNLQIANPVDQRCEERYCAWLILGLAISHGQYSWQDSSLVLDPFVMGDRGFDPGYPQGFGLTEVHELFHAVQNGYDIRAVRGEAIDWIIEGTAVHVARSSEALLQMSFDRQDWLRTYDQPLHIPPSNNSRSPEFNTWEYGSWEFFDFLGDHLESADGVQYLDHLLGTLAPNQKNGLLAVEAAIRAEAGKTLYQVFPEFVARRLTSPCYFSHLGSWEGNDCVEGPDNEHRFELTFPDTITREDGSKDLSANGYLVRLEVPEGESGHLLIRLPDDSDEEDKHLIVGDRRLDEPGSAGSRNQFSTILPSGSHEFLVRLANVPTDVTEVDTNAWDFTIIEFMLQREYASAQVTGSESAHLDGVLFTYINPDADANAIAAEITPALADDYADHAGLDPETEDGQASREMIQQAVVSAQTQEAESAGAAQGGAEGPARCIVHITMFNDEERSLASLTWEGSGPFLGREHVVRAGYSHDLPDVLYGTVKQVGHEIAIIDDPEQAAQWGSIFQNLSIPGLQEFIRMGGDEGADAMAGGLGEMFGNMPMPERREGEAPEHRPGRMDSGRSYDQGGVATLRVAESQGEMVAATFDFTASSDEGGSVSVEGGFATVPGPIISRFLKSGCEEMGPER